MPRDAKPGMAWLHNIELRQEFLESLEMYCRNTGATRKDALEYALSHLPTFQGTPDLPVWAAQIQEQFIERKRPFILNYRDASDRAFSWTVRYAEFVTHEKRSYLDFWADEQEDNQDIEPLSHNWCIRLDRIVSVDPVPSGGEWRQGLDTVEVEFHLYKGLSYAYAKETQGLKKGDIVSIRLDADTRRVVRRISNTFWFIREIARYVDDCQVIAPDSVRSLILDKAQRLVGRYS
jgi:predicted DNA-binding transcriptional regulator YafY